MERTGGMQLFTEQPVAWEKRLLVQVDIPGCCFALICWFVALVMVLCLCGEFIRNKT